MSSRKVFLSVGRSSRPEQEEFLKALENYLQENKLIPQTVGRTYYSSQQPLKAVQHLMKECSGTMIVAFERLHIIKAIEKRGDPNQTIIKDLNLPTVWNQIEAAMAYMVGHPLFVLVENGLKNEGLLEIGYDWFVKWITLDKSIFSDPEFIGIFSDWKSRVEKYKLPKN